MTTFQRLQGAGPGPLGLVDALAGFDPRRPAPPARPYVYFNMITSPDGRAALAGSTKALGGAADTELLVELRVRADAVLIGTGTVAAEGYDTLVRAREKRARRIALGMPATPLAVIPARSGRVPWEAGLFAATDQPVVVYTGPGGATPPASVRAPVEVVALADPAPGAMLADLRRRGVRALLSEGGPTVLGGFAAAGVIDELFVTIANVLVGEAGALRILEGPELAAPSRLALRGVLRSGDELYLRYRVHPG